jgi:hypothetical protein
MRTRSVVPHPYRYVWPPAGCAVVLAGLIAFPAQAQTLPAEPSSASPAAAAPAPDPSASAGPPSDGAPADATASAHSKAEPAAVSEVQTGAGLFERSTSTSEPTAKGDAATVSPQAFDLNGYVRSDFFVGKAPNSSGVGLQAGYGELALRLRTRKEKYGDAFAETRLNYGLQQDETKLNVDLREAYVNTYVGPLDLRLGHQIIVWGRADAFNPTNNLTPLDLRVRSPLEDDRRLANLGLRAFLNLAPLRIEAVWLPIYRATQVPGVVSPSYVDFKYTSYPRPALQNGTEAARVHLELPAFEASVSYLYGYAPLPGLALNGVSQGLPVGDSVIPQAQPIRIERRAYDQHVVGFDFSTALGDALALRGEAAFRSPLHYKRRVHAPDPDIQYVLGADRSFGNVSVIAQYMGRVVLDWRRAESPEFSEDPAALGTGVPAAAITQALPLIEAELRVRNQMLFSQLHRVQHLATVRVEWLGLHETLSLSALAFLNFSTQEWLAFPKLAYKLSDNLSTSVGAEIFAGPTGTLFGLIDRQLTAGYAELRYGF